MILLPKEYRDKELQNTDGICQALSVTPYSMSRRWVPHYSFLKLQAHPIFCISLLVRLDTQHESPAARGIRVNLQSVPRQPMAVQRHVAASVHDAAHRRPPANKQGLPRDKRCLRIREKHDGAHHVAGGTESPHGHLFDGSSHL